MLHVMLLYFLQCMWTCVSTCELLTWSQTAGSCSQFIYFYLFFIYLFRYQYFYFRKLHVLCLPTLYSIHILYIRTPTWISVLIRIQSKTNVHASCVTLTKTSVYDTWSSVTYSWAICQCQVASCNIFIWQIAQL